MPARLTDITALTGLRVESSSAPARGTAGAAVGAAGAVVGDTEAVGVMDAAVGAMDAEATDAEATDAGATAHADRRAAFMAVADTEPAVDSMAVVVVSTVAEAVASTVVEAGTAAEADTAKSAGFSLPAVMRKHGWQQMLPAVRFFPMFACAFLCALRVTFASIAVKSFCSFYRKRPRVDSPPSNILVLRPSFLARMCGRAGAEVVK